MPDLTIDGFVDDVARRSNIDPAAAETAVGTILSVIQQEANPSTVTQVFDHFRVPRISRRNMWWWRDLGRYGRRLEQFSR